MSDVFLMGRLELWVWGRKRKSAVLIASYEGYIWSTWLFTVDLGLSHLAELYLSDFSAIK